MKKILLFLFFPLSLWGQDGLKTLSAGGSVNAYTISESLPSAYDTRERFQIIFPYTNTGASTLKRAALAIKAIKKPDGTALSSGDLVAGSPYLISYNSSAGYYICETCGSSGGGGGSVNFANNGTILSGDTVQQGGSFTKNTTYNINGHSLEHDFTGGGFIYRDKYDDNILVQPYNGTRISQRESYVYNVDHFISDYVYENNSGNNIFAKHILEVDSVNNSSDIKNLLRGGYFLVQTDTINGSGIDRFKIDKNGNIYLFPNNTTGSSGQAVISDGTGKLSYSSLEVPLTFNNGLTRTTNTIKLGGAFTATTQIGSNGTGNFVYDNTGTIWNAGSVGMWYGTPGNYSLDYSYFDLSAQTIDMGAKNISSSRSVFLTLQTLSGTPTAVLNGTSSVFAGLKYNADYSANYTLRSLIDKGYATATFAPISITGTVTSIATTSPITGGTITSTGTIACATCVTSAASLTSNALVIGGGSQATSTTTTGTGVLTALGVNTGSSGAFVVNGGSLGTPSSGVATNLTGTASGLTAGNATTLVTPRAIYGNNFDGSAALTQIIASTYGGTGNGFTKFSGPTTSEKTFTLPNASATVLTDNTAVTAAQGGTGQNTSSSTGVAQVISGTWSVSTSLANGTTATTQSAGDNSTKVATTAYADAKPANMGPYQFCTAAVSPANATTYFFGTPAVNTVNTTNAVHQIYFRQACTITAAEFNSYASTTAGSNEALSLYIRVNDATDYLIQTVSTNVASRVFSSTSLSISIANGDYIEFKLVCPTWSTRPAGWSLGGYITAKF